ncbi:Fpg/Nei family DNA glycosylase [Skermania sp. ID1734]|uniref:Fpg/Nei family DNA glycosylase n=1 Tax=Skermania sp. ID1734 TaxID=2597516 RepID=UPI00117E125E|nr:DNA-formamidopyrimidine glycosylase family protein [Skermania sp. ID1734]TSD99998.1 Fpg/Nei family DNA glycosylase [Skermania sp. ID1734]
MPEGPTLHRLARVHQQQFAGSPVRVSSPQGKFAEGAALVDGRVLVKAEAWGKHLLHHYDSGLMVHVHLGLYGAFSEAVLPMGEPVGQVRMRMVGEGFGADLRGPTACEVLHAPEWEAIAARLGPDPLRRKADPELAWARIAKSRKPIGALLMDQRVLAGVGNVYRAELLFRHEVSPFRPGTDMDRETWAAMWDDLVQLMRIALRRGKIITIRREDDHGEPGYAKGRPRTYVYRRIGSNCRICGTPVAHQVMEGRNLFWCPTCQAG